MKEILLSCSALALLIISGCKKADNPNNETEHEAVNRVELIFKSGSTVVATYIAEDPDGDGGNPPSRIDKINLLAGSSYTVEVVLKNVSNSVVKDISQSIRDQGKEHEFYFLPSGINVTITKTDKDANGYPLGFNSTWTASTSKSTGKVQLKLMHKPRIKGAADDPSKGHSDLTIDFPAEIQ